MIKRKNTKNRASGRTPLGLEVEEALKEVKAAQQGGRPLRTVAARRSKPLTQLGRKTSIPASPDKAKLETVPKPFSQYDYLVRLVCPEFTTLCPITGQPDFAHIVIDYVPGKKLVESKSLKLFLQSFRNHGDFHEACTVTIGDRLLKALAPKWIRVSGYWYPRGGIPIDVFFERGNLPKTVTVPETGVANYRGRG